MTMKPIPRRVIQAIFASPWAISAEWLATLEDWANPTAQEWLETIVAIARREPREQIEAVEARLGRPLSNTHDVTIRENGVAIIPVSGPIFRYADAFGMISGGVATETLMQDITSAIENPAVRAIVMNFDTPGGQLNGINELANHIDAMSRVKPIKSYTGGLLASAGFPLAAATNEIVADPTAVVGSLGVIATVDTSRSSIDGKTLTIVSSQSPNKNLDPSSEAGRTALQQMVDDHAQHMLETIAGFRGVGVEDIVKSGGAGGTNLAKNLAGGPLVDRLGSLESLIAELGRPRVAPASTNPNRGGMKAMSKNPNAAPAAEQTEIPTAEAATPEAIAALTSEVVTLREELATAKAERAKAQTEKQTAEANAQVEAWVREGRITGNATEKVRGVYVASCTGQAITKAQVEDMIASLPKLETKQVSAGASPAPTGNEAPTADDVRAADRGNKDARVKIDAHAKALVAADPKLKYTAAVRSIRTAALAAK